MITGLESRMEQMGAERRHAVRIAQPEGSPDDAAWPLASTIAPLVGWEPDPLAEALLAGPVIVAEDVSEADGEGLRKALVGLGAHAELLVGHEGAWRLPGTQPEAVSSTLPLGASRAPQALPSVPSGTHPLDLSALRAALDPSRRAPLERSPTPSASPRPPIDATVPFDVSGVRERLKASDPGLASTQQIDFSSLRTQMTPTAGGSIKSTVAGMPATRPLSRAALLEPPAMTAPNAAVQVPHHEQATQRVTPAPEVRGSAQTQRFGPMARARALEVETTPVPSRSARRIRQTQGLLPASHAPRGSVEQTLPVAAAEVPADQQTSEIARQRPEIEATGSLGSFNGGPLVFQLQTPRSVLTETGSVPMPVELTLDEEPSMAGDESLDAPSVNEAASEDGRIDRSRIAGRVISIPTPAPVHRESTQRPMSGIGMPMTSVPPANGPIPAGPTPATIERGDQLFTAASAPPIATDGPPPRVLPPPPTQPMLRSAMRPGATHSALRATALSLVLPGMGQVYNGERDRGIWFALGAVFILPWLWSVVDAGLVAGRIHRGEAPEPSPWGQRGALSSQLVLNLSIIFGVVVGVVLWQRVVGQDPQRSAPVAPAPVVPDAAIVDAAPPPPDAAPALTDSDRQQIRSWLREGRMKCGKKLFAECEEIMHAVLAKDPDNGEAYTLLVEATAARKSAEGK